METGGGSKCVETGGCDTSEALVIMFFRTQRGAAQFRTETWWVARDLRTVAAGIGHVPRQRRYPMRHHAEEKFLPTTGRWLHRDHGLPPRLQAARGTGMDLRDQAGQLSLGGCADW
jgi:hypothetical protein